MLKGIAIVKHINIRNSLVSNLIKPLSVIDNHFKWLKIKIV